MPSHKLGKSLSLKIGLPSLILASVLGIAPNLAAETVPNSVRSSDPVMVASLPRFLRDVNRGVRVIRPSRRRRRVRIRRPRSAAAQRRLRLRRMSIAERRQLRKAQRRRRALQRRKARQLAIARERQYVNSLSPQQQKAYWARKRAQQRAQRQLMTGIGLLLLGDMMSGDGGGSYSQNSDDYRFVSGGKRATRRSAPRPVRAIAPLYRKGPRY